MDELFQHFLNATILGGTYALLGIGLTLIFGIMRVVNFTHGELYAFGAYCMYALVMLFGVNFFAALALAMLLGAIMGGAIELLLLNRLRGADIDTTMLVMIGAWIVMQNSEQLVWSGVALSIKSPFPAEPLVLGPLSVSWNRVYVFVIALVLIAVTYYVVNRTRLGKAMRATFQDRDTAALMGVRIERIHTATFALGSSLAAAAGALLGPVFVVAPTMGDLAASKAFAIVILGGLGNITGATLGGFILAFVEEIGAGYISSGYRDAMGFLLIILILLVRPTGLFARKEQNRVSRYLGWFLVAFLASVPSWLNDFYFLHVLITTGIFIIAAMSSQFAARVHRAAFARPCCILRHRRLHERACLARIRCARAARRHGWRCPEVCLVRHAVCGLGRRPHWLWHWQIVLPRAWGLFRDRLDQLRRGRAAGCGQLGRADAGSDGA